jgi:hypothetical protein
MTEKKLRLSWFTPGGIISPFNTESLIGKIIFNVSPTFTPWLSDLYALWVWEKQNYLLVTVQYLQETGIPLCLAIHDSNRELFHCT